VLRRGAQRPGGRNPLQLPGRGLPEGMRISSRERSGVMLGMAHLVLVALAGAQ
jgi:hypothetical protein